MLTASHKLFVMLFAGGLAWPLTAFAQSFTFAPTESTMAADCLAITEEWVDRISMQAGDS